MRLLCLFLILLCLGSASLYAQVVNIESARMQTDSVRFVLSNDFSFRYNDNDGNYIFEVSDAIYTQLKSKDFRKLYFFLANFGLIRSKGEDFSNNWLVHLRFNYRLTRVTRLETFVQSQGNQLLDVSGRHLLGAGLRFRAIATERVRLYLANSYMYELEISDALNQNFYNHRNNTYMSFSLELPKSKITITNILYYQPLYRDISNYNISEQFKIEVPLNEKISVNSSFYYYFDSQTPGNRSQYTSTFYIGIGINI